MRNRISIYRHPAHGFKAISVFALLLSLVGLGLLFVVNATANSGKGLVAVFAFTGVMGASLGPMLNYYLALPNGPGLVMQALGGTALVFFALSGYANDGSRKISVDGNEWRRVA